MPAISHVVRRGAIFYWRRRIPAALAESCKSATLLLGLRTSDSRRARFLVGQITALVDLHLLPAAMSNGLTQSQLQTIFREVFARHLDKLDVVATRDRREADFDLEANRRSERIVGWAHRLLETRGLSATVDERAKAQMRLNDMKDDEIAETGEMLAELRRLKFVPDSENRLAGLVEKAGGEPSTMNFALAQEQIYRGMAEAAFHCGTTAAPSHPESNRRAKAQSRTRRGTSRRPPARSCSLGCAGVRGQTPCSAQLPLARRAALRRLRHAPHREES
jgi:hypothetical protein